MSPSSGLLPVGRRTFGMRSLAGLGGIATVGKLNICSAESGGSDVISVAQPLEQQRHFTASARRVIFLFMLGGPSQHDLFDYKPRLNELDGQPIADEFLSQMKFAQIMEKRPSILGTHVRFRRHGESGAEISDLLPNIAGVVDDLAIIKTVQATEIPHHPAEVFLHTGTRQFGRPSIGAWITYGLGSETDELPTFVVLPDGRSLPSGGATNWGAGFLPAQHQGVRLRGGAAPVLDLFPPESLTQEERLASGRS